MTTDSQPVVAICYDFDGTLSKGNMQEYGLISAIGENIDQFWKESNKMAYNSEAEEQLTYMHLLLKKAEETKVPITEESLKQFGEKVSFFPGVEEWFERINVFAQERGIVIEHYIISSGLREMIEGTKIASHFKKVFACSFLYDEEGKAIWPGNIVNFTTKTQFLFRINKDTLDLKNKKNVNDYLPQEERRIPFSRMVYIGDGDTDIPCMKLVKSKGGYSIAVYDPEKPVEPASVAALHKHARVNFVTKANFSENSFLDNVIKEILKKIGAEARLLKLREIEASVIQRELPFVEI